MKKAAISAGLVWGSGLFCAGIVAAITGTYAVEFINAMGSLYPGYAPSYVGAVIGGIWGFIDAWIAAAVVVWIYNKI